MTLPKAFLLLAGLGLASLPSTAGAAVKLPPVLSDHMVLQRDMKVPIWGTAAPGEKVTVKFRDQQKEAEADKAGKWLLRLDPLKAGGPHKLTVAGTNTITIDDVLVGEVWVGSGQSNMAGGVAGYAKGDEMLAKAAAAAPYPTIRLLRGSGRWQKADLSAVRGFSALLFSFGVRLQQELKVPVGLMVGAVGGTPSGPWLSEEAFAADKAAQSALKKFEATYDYEKGMKQYDKALVKWEKDVEAAKEAKKKPPRKPAPPAKVGELTKGKIGGLYRAHVKPMVPFGIRGVLWDQGESGTAVPGVDQYVLMGALIRGWRREWGQGDFPFLYVQKPSGGGPAWDYANATTSRADRFAPLPKKVPGNADGLYRELHVRIVNYPNTAMVLSSDLGAGVHPTNKFGYGDRACLVALGLAYGRKVEYYGPVYEKQAIEGDKVRLSFAHVGKGLAFKHGERLQGFAVAGKDKVWHWADAAIDGNTVVVSSAKVPAPVAVRYAWSARHPWANLFNKDGLPAQAFRTDDW